MSNQASLGNKITSWLERPLSGVFLVGQAVIHILRKQVNFSNTLEQM